MPKPPKNGRNPRKSITVRLPADLVDRLREIGMTDTIEQATMEWVRRIDRGQPVVEINQALIDEEVTHILSDAWSDIITDLNWSVDRDYAPFDLLHEDIIKQLDECESYFEDEDGNYDSDEYDRLFQLHFNKAVDLAMAELDKRISKIRKTIDRLYADVAMLNR